MNRYFMTGMAFLVFLPWPGWSNKSADIQFSSSIPPQITEFYEDYNFVASFSTPSEREQLINLLSRETLPDDLSSDRMNRIFRMMKELYSRMVSIDPKMVIPVGPRTQYIKYFFLPELLDVKRIDRSGEKAVVEVCAYSVEPEFVERFILEYEQSNGKEEEILPEDERLEMVKKSVLAKTEFHIWFLQAGKWMRAEHKNIYIKQ